MKIRNFVEILIVYGLLAASTADLIYLYYSGKWYDPVPWIEITEIISLSFICLYSLVRFFTLIFWIIKKGG